MVTNCKKPLDLCSVEARKCFVETLYDVLVDDVVPTPYLEIEGGDNFGVNFLNGRGRLPNPNSTEINILDVNVASLFSDTFKPLYQGVTGVGKTYTIDAVLNTVFGEEGDGWATIRLGGPSILANTDPTELWRYEGDIRDENFGKIDPSALSKFGAVFIDEISAGDSDKVLELLDGRIKSNGSSHYLRIPIPGEDGKYKELAIFAAMNPPDAEHSHSREMSIAVEDRLHKIMFPNGVSEVGSSQLEKRLTDGLHEKFWNKFSEASGVTGGWREVYPVIADSSKLSFALDGKSREFFDAILGYVGAEPIKAFERNAELMKQVGFSPKFFIDENSNDYKKIMDAQGDLKYGFVKRNLNQIGDFAGVLGFIRGVKDGSYDLSVGLDDVAVSMGVILEGKTITGTENGKLMPSICDFRRAYLNLHKEMKAHADFGICQETWQSAVWGATEEGNQDPFKRYMNTIKANINDLNQDSVTGVSEAVLRSRLLADLGVLVNFSETYEEDVVPILRLGTSDALQEFDKLYNIKKVDSSAYAHRLDLIFAD